MKKLLITSAFATLLMASTPAFADLMDNKTAPENQEVDLYEAMQEEFATLPADKQELVKKTAAENRNDIEAAFKKIKPLREELRAIVTAPSFDKKSFLEKTKQVQDIISQLRSGNVVRIADLAEKLNANERNVLVGILTGNPQPVNKDKKTK